MINDYPMGAEWRKWDLHVHTPFSIYQQFGDDSDETWEKFIADLEYLPDDFAVIGINDYLFIDGYEKLKYEQQHNNMLNKIRLLPVVEFRIDKFAGIQFGGLKRINLHVIFSDDITVETIRSQFLNTLEELSRDNIPRAEKKICGTVTTRYPNCARQKSVKPPNRS